MRVGVYSSAVRTPRFSKAAAISALGACLVLALAWLASEVLPSSPRSIAGGPPYTPGGIADVVRIVVRNACVSVLLFTLVALVTRRASTDRVLRLGVSAAAFAVVVQAIRQGLALGSVADYLGVSPTRLWLTVLPHGGVELAAILFPTVVLILSARGAPTVPASPRIFVAVSIGVITLLTAAASVETFGSPRVYSATLCTSVEPEVTAQGGCKPCPPSAEAEFRRQLRTDIPMSRAASAAIQSGCTWSSNTVPAGYAQPAPRATRSRSDSGTR